MTPQEALALLEEASGRTARFVRKFDHGNEGAYLVEEPDGRQWVLKWAHGDESAPRWHGKHRAIQPLLERLSVAGYPIPRQGHRGNGGLRGSRGCDQLDGIDGEAWTGLSSAAMVVREVTKGDEVTTRDRVSHLSLLPDAEQIANAVRSHWRIENSLHWVLGVTFREDSSRVRRDNSAHGLAVLRHIALNVVRADTSKASMKHKRYRPSLDDDFLGELVFKA